jgi:hypothetical protein
MLAKRTSMSILTVLALAGAMLAWAVPFANAAPPVTGAAFTTTNTAVDGTGHCQNGNEDVNCNIYDGKQYVWMNGGPSTAYVGDGSYFFAVLAPGGQADPNDGSPKNLSDDFDAYTNRTFQVTGGVVSYSGTHTFANNKIRLASYADTPNPGGVYIMAICSLDNYPVTPSSCKYDAFKVEEAPPAQSLTVTKDAVGTYDSAYTWGITKDVDQSQVDQVSGDVTFTYSVAVTKSAPAISNIKVTGTISVFNPNEDPVSNVDVTDQLSDGTVCTVTGGNDQTVPQGETDFPYSCSLSSLPQGDLNNTVTATWPEQFLDDGSLLSASNANFTFNKIVFTAQQVTDGCVTVTDTFNGSTTTLGYVCESTSFATYTHTVPVPPFGYGECSSYTNTATFTTNTTHTTGSASRTVKVCGAAKTGAHHMAYWKNSAGQGIIKSSPQTGGVCNVTGWLRQYAPFQGLATNASCATAAAYVSSTEKAGSAAAATNNARLTGQSLATALNVYYSSPLLGGNMLNAKKPVGNAVIYLLKVCQMTDLTTGAGTCSGNYVDASPAFGGAASLSVSQLLTYVTGQSNAGGSLWYGGNSPLQLLAKHTLAAINNQKAFRAI